VVLSPDSHKLSIPIRAKDQSDASFSLELRFNPLLKTEHKNILIGLRARGGIQQDSMISATKKHWTPAPPHPKSKQKSFY
jgi:hypothetical protein